MKFVRAFAVLLVAAACSPSQVSAQEAAASAVSPVVPHVLRYSGALQEAPAGSPAAQVRFAVYASAAGGEALWTEEQQVTLDAAGKYSVLLGSVTALPDAIFAAGEARWVGVAFAGQAEGARTPLTASAYALKASDAETVGGHPATDFVMAAKDGAKPAAATNISQINVSNGVLGGGTGPTVSLSLDENFLETLGNSLYAQKSAVVSSVAGGNGIDVAHSGTVYTVSLDDNALLALGNQVYAQTGAANSFRGTQTLAATGAASASAGFDSNRLGFSASAFNKSSGAAQNVTYLLQAEPLANDTTVPGASLDLLYALGANTPVETGFKIASNGVVTFGAAQTFPGTITSITAGNGISTSASGSAVTVGVSSAFQATLPTLAGDNSFTGANTFDGAQTINNTLAVSNSGGTGMSITDTNTSGTALVVNAPQTSGANGVGISGSGGAAGVEGGSAYGAGVNGFTTTSGHVGVAGFWGSQSGVYGANSTRPAGVIGDGGTGGATGVLGTSDNGKGGNFLNNSTSNVTLSATNSNAGGAVAQFLGPAANTGCTAFANGNFGCSGQMQATSTYIANTTSTTAALVSSGSTTGTYPTLKVLNSNTSNTHNSVVAQFLGDNGGSGCTVFGDGVFSCSSALDGFASSGYAINGQATSSSANGVFGGYSSTSSAFGRGSLGQIAGVIADGGASSEGVIGTSDLTAGDFTNNSNFATVYMSNLSTGAGLVIADNGSGDNDNAINVYNGGGMNVAVFSGPNGNCTVQLSGTLLCSGDIKSYDFVPGPGKGKSLATSAVQGAKSWVEDADTAQLIDGRALVHLDASLQAVADTGATYQVFLTPGGDCAGLYVSHKKADSFEVHELGGGHSSLSFDYKIMVSRRGGTATKFEDVTAQLEAHRHAPGTLRPVSRTAGNGN